MARKKSFRHMAAAWDRLLQTVEANESVLPAGRDHAAQLRRCMGSRRAARNFSQKTRRKLRADRIYSTN